jgi:RNA polymerase sigma factor (TIGR02999 family)
MSAEDSKEITQLLKKVRDGDKQAENQLAELLMPELKKLAHLILSSKYRGHTMETGDLVNTIYLKLQPAFKTFNDSAHFKAYAATAMYHHLIDRARKVIRRTEHLGQQAPFEDAERVAQGEESVERAMQFIALSEGIQQLKADKERTAQVVVLKMGGLTNEEIAEFLNVDVSTVKREWRPARAFLLPRLG